MKKAMDQTRRTMKIAAPQITVQENQAVLSAEITREGMSPFLCQFFYPAEYQQYLCSERADAFLVSVLPFAMQHGFDIQCEMPVSGKLLHQIKSYYIPVLAQAQPDFKFITVEAQADNRDLNVGKAVGTGLSCGVDSFYSVLRYMQPDVENGYKLTHVVSMNVGSFGYQGGEFSRKWFQEELVKARRVAKKLQLPLIEVDSNLMEFYQQNHATSGTFRMAGAILGLQKLFAVYYIGAGFSLKTFDICSPDNDDYDLFNLMVACNESTEFYSSGIEATRFERTRFISDFPVTHSELTVCLKGDKNCGRCEKCLRTIGTLYVLGKLDSYRDCFDVNYFYKHKHRMLVKIRCNGIGYMKDMYGEIYGKWRKENPVYYFLITVEAYLFQLPCDKLVQLAKRIAKKVLSPEQVAALKEKMRA